MENKGSYITLLEGGVGCVCVCGGGGGGGRVVGWCKGVMYLTSPGGPRDIGSQLGKTCYPCSR